MKKSLKKNYIYNLAYQILVMAMPLIVTPYLSRVLGAEKIGVYSFTLSVLSYFTLFGCLGINLYGQREIAKVQDDRKKRSKVFFELFLLKFCSIFISFIIYALFNYSNNKYGLFYKILTIDLFANLLDITWFYQGVEDFKKITIRNTIIRITSTILIFVFVNSKNDLIKYFIICVLTNFFGYLILWLNLNKYIIKIKINKLNIIRHLRPTISLFIPQIAIQIYTVFDKTMLGYILNDMSEIGYYEQSQKIVKMLLMLITAIGTVMVPRISNLYANKKIDELNEKIFNVFNIVSIFAFPICFGLIAVSKNFVPWFYGNDFLSVVNLLSIFSFLLLFIGYNNITGMQYLVPTNNQRILTISVFCGAIINLILNYFLIPMYKANGAAIATVISELTILFIHIFCLRKKFNFSKIVKSNFKYFLISIFMSIIVFLLGNNLEPTMLTTVIQVLVGVTIYFILLLITKDKLLLYILNIINKKLILKLKKN